MVRPRTVKKELQYIYECDECGAEYEDKVSANLCCKDDIETLDR